MLFQQPKFIPFLTIFILNIFDNYQITNNINLKGSTSTILVTSSDHTCYISVNLKLYCWGMNHEGQTNIPYRHAMTIDVGVGNAHTCAIQSYQEKEGEQNHDSAQDQDQDQEEYQDPKSDHSDTDSKKSSFYTATDSQSKENSNYDNETHKESRDSNIDQTNQEFDSKDTCNISSTQPTLPLKTSKTIVKLTCWGNDSFLQSTIPSVSPELESSSSIPSSVSLGFWHTCIIDQLDHLRCWGMSHMGQSDVPIIMDTEVDVHDAAAASSTQERKFMSINAGFHHTCAISKRFELACFGGNTHGQIDVPNLFISGIIQVSAGFLHTCAINKQDEISCFGNNLFNQINFSSNTRDIEVDYKYSSAGFQSTCAIESRGQLACFGMRKQVQFQKEHKKMFRRMRQQQVAVGQFHSCGVVNDMEEKVICWGQNENRQLDVPPRIMLII